jgi:hypothetical protein
MVYLVYDNLVIADGCRVRRPVGVFAALRACGDESDHVLDDPAHGDVGFPVVQP